MIQDLAQTSVKNATSDLANDAVAQQIENGNIQYDRMVYFEKDVNGRITALKTNIGEINHLKTDILNIINGKILELDAVDIGIPVGSLFLPEFFPARGRTFRCIFWQSATAMPPSPARSTRRESTRRSISC